MVPAEGGPYTFGMVRQEEAALSTSESVNEGLAKKICDQVSDAVLVGIYEQPPDIAGGVHVGGESEMDVGPGGQEIRSGYTTDRKEEATSGKSGVI